MKLVPNTIFNLARLHLITICCCSIFFILGCSDEGAQEEIALEVEGVEQNGPQSVQQPVKQPTQQQSIQKTLPAIEQSGKEDGDDWEDQISKNGDDSLSNAIESILKTENEISAKLSDLSWSQKPSEEIQVVYNQLSTLIITAISRQGLEITYKIEAGQSTCNTSNWSIDPKGGVLEGQFQLDHVGNCDLIVSANTSVESLTRIISFVVKVPIKWDTQIGNLSIVEEAELNIAAVASDSDSSQIRYSLGENTDCELNGFTPPLAINSITGKIVVLANQVQNCFLEIAAVSDDSKTTQDVMIEVLPKNKPPVWDSGLTDFEVIEDLSFSILSSATDPESDPILYSIVLEGSTCLSSNFTSQVSINPSTSEISGQPSNASVGSCSIHVRAIAGEHQIDKILNLSVSNENDILAWTTVLSDQTLSESGSLSLVASATDIDPESSIFYSLNSDGTCDEFTWQSPISIDSASGRISIYPNHSSLGTCSLSIDAHSDGDTINQKFNITVIDDVVPNAPTPLSQINPAENRSQNMDITLSASLLESGSQLRVFKSQNCTGTPITELTISETSETFNISGLGEGTHSFSANQTDSAGNTSNCSAHIDYEVDLTPPESVESLVHSESAPTHDSSPNISWAPSGSSDVGSYIIRLGSIAEGFDVVNDSNIGNTTSYQFAGLNLTECQRYFPSVLVVDTVNLMSGPTSSSGFIFDITPPSPPTELLLGPDVAEINVSKLLSWTAASDNCSEPLSYELSIGTFPGDTDIKGWKNVGAVGSFKFSETLNMISDTDYYLNIRSVDIGGNKSTSVSSEAWRLPGEPGAVTDLALASARTNSIEIAWTKPFDNGSPIIDYIIEYKEKASSDWVLLEDGESSDTIFELGGLLADTEYDFRVRTYNGSISDFSNIITARTLIDTEFFNSDNGFAYKTINLGGAEESKIVAFEETTKVRLNGIDLITLNAGETHGFASALNDLIESDKPVFVAGRLGSASAGDQNKGNMVWSTPDWVGKTFLFNAYRDSPAIITVHAFEDTDITITKGSTIVSTASVGEGDNYTFSISQYGSFQLDSAGLIIGYIYSKSTNSVADPKPLLPMAKDLIGFPSRWGRISTLTDNTDYTLYHSDGHTATGSISADEMDTIDSRGDKSYYKGPSMRIIANADIIANSYADYNGYCAAPFLPVNMMRKRYAVNVNSEYVAFASLESGTIKIIAPDGTETEVNLTRGTEDPNVPYRARIANIAEGTRFESTTRFAAWYEPSTNSYAADNDETILYGFD